MAFQEADAQWHAGEEEMHRLLRVPHMDNPTQPGLPQRWASNILFRSPLIALGTIDADGRIWTTVWGGEAGFSRAIAQDIIGVKSTVDRQHDPVLEALLGGKADGEVVQGEGTGKMISGLSINLESRSRVKLYGRMAAGALVTAEEGVGEVQLVIRIEQSLGNCPKYLNKKHILPHKPHPKLVSKDLPLPPGAVSLLANSDLFFISSSNHETDMDNNHRGGPPGFVRILSNVQDDVSLVYPEYSGNRLYQTLGNLRVTPQAGLVFPDFTSGNVLYISGKTEILVGQAATDLIARTNLAVKITVEAARFVSDGLAFRGHQGEFSPYNPPVRHLTIEKSKGTIGEVKQIAARLIDREIISPTIARFRFQITGPARGIQWKPGQYVALSFQDELDIGYSHMRDDDPRSLNDDFLRTFTVSSRQDSLDGRGLFELMIRKLGVVSDHLFKVNLRSGLEVPLRGFGGEFFVEQDEGESVAFVAGGLGITPLLPTLPDLDLRRLHLFWAVRAADVRLLVDTMERFPGLAKSAKLFVTGEISHDSDEWKGLVASGATVEMRRLAAGDLTASPACRWYLCTGTAFRDSLLNCLQGQEVLYEDFNY
ncbi:hypothetical protein PZA11_000252 [Diplocarpon coronariae]|uniref:Oxidoreductase n=1 Tax=Diplocarpon coronariae TaxID=2795749 RepID=A0A218Z2L3_9HELO|nr:oxidoreductase [Marssonina coronariae]